MGNESEAALISIHAPVKGATRIREPFRPPGSHFNPCSREGSDVSETSIHDDPPISIHAPVKGATAEIGPQHFRVLISIHAPVKGATCPACLG